MPENIEPSYIEEEGARGLKKINEGDQTPLNMDEINLLLSKINPDNPKDSILALGKLDSKINSIESLNEGERGKIFDKLSFFTSELNDNSARGLKMKLDYSKAFISGVNDLLSDLQRDNGLFNIEDKSFQKMITMLVVDKERAGTGEIMNNPNASFVITAEKLDSEIGSDSKVVLIGINDYANGDDSDLLGSVNDVNAMKQMVMEVYGIPEANITIISDLSATKDNILKTIDDLSSRDEDDSGILVYYAGHGISKAEGDVEGALKGESFIVPSSADMSDGLTKDELISSNEISNAIKGKGLVITDMCYSGGFIKNLDSDLNGIGSSDNELAYETNTERGINEEAKNKLDSDYIARGQFSYNFVKGMKESGGNIKDTLVNTAQTTKYQKEVVKGSTS